MQLQTSPSVLYQFSSQTYSSCLCVVWPARSQLPLTYPMWTFTYLLRLAQNAYVKPPISVNCYLFCDSQFKKTGLKCLINKRLQLGEILLQYVIYCGWWLCFFPPQIRPALIPVSVVCVHMYYFYHLVFINDFVHAYILNLEESSTPIPDLFIYFKERMK